MNATFPTPSEPRDGASYLIVDASKVSPLRFMDMVFGTSDETRAAAKAEMHRDCIAAIKRGNTYGWPPMMVAQCRKVMAGMNSEIAL